MELFKSAKDLVREAPSTNDDLHARMMETARRMERERRNCCMPDSSYAASLDAAIKSIAEVLRYW